MRVHTQEHISALFYVAIATHPEKCEAFFRMAHGVLQQMAHGVLQGMCSISSDAPWHPPPLLLNAGARLLRGTPHSSKYDVLRRLCYCFLRCCSESCAALPTFG